MAWARVQGTSSQSGTNPTSWTITHPGATTVNNRLILGISYNGNNGSLPTISTVSDSTNTYASDRTATGANDSGYFTRGAFYSANVVSSTTPTVTVTLSAALTGGDTITLTLEEYSGLDTSATPVDVGATSAATLGVATSGATAATNAANELAVALYADDGGNNTPSASGGPTAFTTRQSVVTSATGQVVFGDADSGASGSTVTATFTPVGAGGNVIHAVVYKLAAAAAGQAAVMPGFSWTNRTTFPLARMARLATRPPLPSAPTGADLTLAITGVSSTLAAGSVIPSTTVPSTGVSSTTAVGTVVSSTTVPSTGVASTLSVGSVTPSTTVTVTGVSSTTAVGSVTETHGGTVSITGVSATTAVGTVTFVPPAGGFTGAIFAQTNPVQSDQFVQTQPGTAPGFTAAQIGGSGFVSTNPAATTAFVQAPSTAGNIGAIFGTAVFGTSTFGAPVAGIPITQFGPW